ncbi:ABC transporter permease [Cytophagales bacterium WSM2-2]|nr:ABC transporter permease [Cytophagales bacterium WSM2-2]
MLRNYFVIVWRNFSKNTIYMSLNALGMGIAIACCIVAYLSYKFNSSFDTSHLQFRSIYRVNSLRTSQNSRIVSASVPLPLGDLIRDNLSDVEEVVRYNPSFGNFRVGEEVFSTPIDYFDKNVFDVFSFKFLAGSPSAISDKTKIIISEGFAKRLFGREAALGKMIVRTDVNPAVTLEVGGVIEDPAANSSFNSVAILSYQTYLDINSPERNNWKVRSTLFVQVKNRHRVKIVENSISTYTKDNNQANPEFTIERFALDPLKGMAVRDDRQKRADKRTAFALPAAAVTGPSFMAIFILLIACFNFINTFLFMASARLKEIGVRKVLGGIRTSLIVQYMSEALLVCLVSMIAGLMIAKLLIPAYNQLWPFLKLKFDFVENTDVYIFLGFLLLLISIVSGSYPAFYISKFQPIQVLNGKQKFGNTGYLSHLLLTLQFAISAVGVISALAFYQNAKYQQYVDVGYNQKGVIFTPVATAQDFNVYKNLLGTNKKITSIGGAKDHMNVRPYGIRTSVKSADRESEVFIADVGDGYLKTCGIELKHGRDFLENSKTDYKESVIITENLAEQFGWAEPLGKELRVSDSVKYFVVGVIKDVLTHGLWEKPDPLVLRYRPDKLRFLLVSVSTTDVQEVNDFMKSSWKKNFPNLLYKGELNDRELTTSTLVNTNIVKLFLFLGVVALTLSASGLFTSVSLTIIRKLKEVSIRKICGAPISNLIKVVCSKHVIILTIASTAGVFLARLLCRLLMNSLWEYYLPPNLGTFALAIAIIVLISFLTILFQMKGVVNLNPAKTLKET